ncbi:hypothetical protein CsSME_00008439 [Camellia sinensis var. sinensis]
MGSNHPTQWGNGGLHMRGRKRKMRIALSKKRKETQKRLKQLKSLIPGGLEMDNLETLIQTTANYISLLECKVSLLRNCLLSM